MQLQGLLTTGGTSRALKVEIPKFNEVPPSDMLDRDLLFWCGNYTEGNAPKFNKYSKFVIQETDLKQTTLSELVFLNMSSEIEQQIKDKIANFFAGTTEPEDEYIEIPITTLKIDTIPYTFKINELTGGNGSIGLQYTIYDNNNKYSCKVLFYVKITNGDNYICFNSNYTIELDKYTNTINHSVGDIGLKAIELYDGDIRLILGTTPVSTIYRKNLLPSGYTINKINLQIYNRQYARWNVFIKSDKDYIVSGNYNPEVYTLSTKFVDAYVNEQVGVALPTSISGNQYTIDGKYSCALFINFTGHQSAYNQTSGIDYQPSIVNKYQNGLYLTTAYDCPLFNPFGLDLGTTEYNIISDDIYAPDPEPGGGNGSYEGDMEIIGISDIPLDVANWLGSRTLYRLDPGKALAFFNYLMSADVGNTWSKFQSNPDQYIISFMSTWVPLVDTETTTIHIAGVDTEIEAHYIQNNIVELEYGPFTATHYYDNFLDYAPYSSYEIYIPYVGFKKLNPEDVFIQNGLRLIYRLNVMTGAGIAYIVGNNTVLYEYTCRMNSPEPLSSADFSQKYFSALKSVAGVGIATAGALTGNVPAMIGGVGMAVPSAISAFKPADIQRISEQDPAATLLMNREPYLLITRPSRYLPKGFGHLFGYKSNMVRTIGELKGYTKVKQINLHIPEATADEVEEIVNIMKGGFYVY